MVKFELIKKNWHVGDFRFKIVVNTSTYCSRTYTAYGRDIHATSITRSKPVDYKQPEWSRKLKKATTKKFKRIERRLNRALEINQHMQEKIQDIKQKQVKKPTYAIINGLFFENK